MYKLKFVMLIKHLVLNRIYLLYSIFYGLTTLIIPLAVQYLVNNLALAGIWTNTLTFMVIIGLGVVLIQCFRYYQIIITEYIQRELFVNEIKRWQQGPLAKKSFYYFELDKLLSNYSKAFTSLVELALFLIFGLITIIFFHPGFIILPILIFSIIFTIFSTFKPAVESSIHESDQKYRFHAIISENQVIRESEIDLYLGLKERHFYFVKRTALLVGVTFFASQILLLGLGIYLIELQQLSVGQLVSAEIILSGILSVMIKLPQTMEYLYDFETGYYKLTNAVKEVAVE
jgi:hypothetical protein